MRDWWCRGGEIFAQLRLEGKKVGEDQDTKPLKVITIRSGVRELYKNKYLCITEIKLVLIWARLSWIDVNYK